MQSRTITTNSVASTWKHRRITVQATGRASIGYNSYHTPLIYTLLSVIWMNNKNTPTVQIYWNRCNLIFSLPMEWENEIYFRSNSHPQGWRRQGQCKDSNIRGICQTKCISKRPRLWQSNLCKTENPHPTHVWMGRSLKGNRDNEQVWGTKRNSVICSTALPQSMTLGVHSLAPLSGNTMIKQSLWGKWLPPPRFHHVDLNDCFSSRNKQNMHFCEMALLGINKLIKRTFRMH